MVKHVIRLCYPLLMGYIIGFLGFSYGDICPFTCPHGYEPVNLPTSSEPLTCIKPFMDEKTFDKALTSCANDGAKLVTILNEDTQAVAEKIQRNRMTNFWIGMRANTTKPKWIYPEKVIEEDYESWTADEPVVEAERRCVMFTRRGWQMHHCEAYLPYMCGYDRDQIQLRRKPLVSMDLDHAGIEGSDRSIHLFASHHLTGTCTVTREDTLIHTLKPHVYVANLKGNFTFDLHIDSSLQTLKEPTFDSRTGCAVRSSVKFLFVADRVLFPERFIIYCQDHRDEGQRGSVHNSRWSNSYKKVGPFRIIDSPPKPKLDIGGDFKNQSVSCESAVDADYTLTWGVNIRGKRTKVDRTNDYFYVNKEMRPSGRMFSVLRIKNPSIGMTVTCYNRPYRPWCDTSSSWCVKTPPLIDNEIILTIVYHRAHQLIYEGRMLEANCSGPKVPSSSITWVIKGDFGKGELLAEGNNTVRRDVFVSQTINSPDQRHATSVLKIQNAKASVYNGRKLICFLHLRDTTDFKCGEMEGQCKASPMLKIIRGPEMPKLFIKYSGGPELSEYAVAQHVALVGQSLVATCEAFVGTGGRLLWALHLNGLVITESKRELDIRITTVDIAHDRQASILKIASIAEYHNSLVISCFSYDVTLTSKPDFWCRPRVDKLCKTSKALRVLSEGDWHFDFGRGKIHKYILLCVGWAFLVTIVHLVIWNRADFATNETQDFDDADYTQASDFLNAYDGERHSEEIIINVEQPRRLSRRRKALQFVIPDG